MLELLIHINQKICVILYLSKSRKFIYFVLSNIYIFVMTYFVSIPTTFIYTMVLTLLTRNPINPSVQNILIYNSLFTLLIIVIFMINQLKYNVLKYAILIQTILFIIKSFFKEAIIISKKMFHDSLILVVLLSALTTAPLLYLNHQRLSLTGLTNLLFIIYIFWFLLLIFSYSEIFSHKAKNLKKFIFWTLLFVAISLVTLTQIINDFMSDYSSGILGSIAAVLTLIFAYATVHDKIGSMITSIISEYFQITYNEIRKLAIVERKNLNGIKNNFRSLTIEKKINFFLTLSIFIFLNFIIYFNLNYINNIVMHPLNIIISQFTQIINKINNSEPKLLAILFIVILLSFSIYRLVMDIQQLKYTTEKKFKVYKIVNSVAICITILGFLIELIVPIHGLWIIILMSLIMYVSDKFTNK